MFSKNVAIYRPPSSDSENLSAFLQNMEKSVSEKKTSYIIGYFNMNCLKYHGNPKTNHFTITFLKKVPSLS